MQPHFSKPNYGPSRFTLNFEVEPAVSDYADALFQLCFFLPCEMFLKSLFSSLRFLRRKEKNILATSARGHSKLSIPKN